MRTPETLIVRRPETLIVRRKEETGISAEPVRTARAFGLRRRSRRCRDIRSRLTGNYIPTHMRGIRARWTACVENGDDLSVVSLVNTRQAPTGEKPAREPSQYAH